jgi:hypothetical protein
MWKRIDESPAISQFIRLVSNSLAQQRGLVPVVGVGLVVFGWLLLLVNVFVGSLWLEFPGVFLQGLGIIAALVGLLLAEPLGK